MMKDWTPRDYIAAMLAVMILLFGLVGMLVVAFAKVPFGDSFKEIMLVLSGGLTSWLGGSSGPKKE